MRSGLYIPLLVLSLFATASAHDIPNDVAVQLFVHPAGDRLQLIVRAPLAAMRDVNFATTGPGYLDLTRIDAMLREAATVWIAGAIDVYEDGAQLPRPRVSAARVSLLSDRSFTAYDTALAHVIGAPLSAGTTLYWNQAMLDVLLEAPIHSEHSRFAIHTGLARLGQRVVIGMRFVPALGPTGQSTVRAFELTGDPGIVELDPTWHQAAWQFVRRGFFHILDGTDHLLFLFCLVIPVRRFRALIPVVTAFTVAHSITLIASAYDLAPGALWFSPLIETLIAVSIVYMALENIVGASAAGEGPSVPRWMVAFGFGLVHGFGFSFALRETMQFAGSHLLSSLLSFNIGVELGQLLVLAVVIPLLGLLFRFAVAEKIGTIILSALIAHTGWHWMLDRWDRLRQYRFEWPALNAAFLADLALWLMVAVVLAGAVWLLSTLPSNPPLTLRATLNKLSQQKDLSRRSRVETEP